jgi:hypothetical protein
MTLIPSLRYSFKHSLILVKKQRSKNISTAFSNLVQQGYVAQ